MNMSGALPKGASGVHQTESQRKEWCQSTTPQSPFMADFSRDNCVQSPCPYLSQYDFFHNYLTYPDLILPGLDRDTAFCQWNENSGRGGFCETNDEVTKQMNTNAETGGPFGNGTLCRNSANAQCHPGDNGCVCHDGCASFSQVVNNFKLPQNSFHYLLESETPFVAHFTYWQNGVPSKAFDGRANVCGSVGMVVVPTSLGNEFDSTYGQMSVLEEYYRLELDTVDVSSFDLNEVLDGSDRPDSNNGDDTCINVFIINSNQTYRCATDWFVGNIIMTRKSEGDYLRPLGHSLVIGVIMLVLSVQSML
jgi:hypothetical protein